MRKILSLILGLLWTLPVWGANCNLFDISQSPTTENISSNLIWTRYNINVSSTSLSVGNWTAKHTDFISPGTYTITFNGTNSSVAIRGYDGSNLSVLRRGNGSFTITNPTQIWIFVADPETMARITEIMLEEGTTATSYVPYNPSCGCDGTVVNYTSATGTVSQAGTPTPTNPIEPTFYKQGNMVLRKVGDYADSYDATTGKITRRVGVKVLDGSEEVSLSDGGLNNARFSTSLPALGTEFDNSISTHFGIIVSTSSVANRPIMRFRPDQQSVVYIYMQDINMTLEQFKSWLAQQYAAGTPVTIYYPLETETTEDWTETSYCSSPIKIATTKYNETKFSPLNTALANAISVVDTVVSNTITQAGRIATLQAQKQTRPNDIADDNEKCPTGKKCLLVEDASGVPHWYEIVTGRLPDGYTELEYIESTGTQWIDTGYVWASQNRKVDMDVMITTHTSNSHFFASTGGSKYDLNPYFSSTNSYTFATYIGNTSYISATSAKDVKNNIVWNLTSDKKFSLQVNGTSVGTATVTEIPTSGISVWLLHVHSSGNNHWNPLRAKLYQTKMWDNDELVRDFIPAKNPDGKVGMYDTVEGRFYENAGTGEFIGGQPVFN